MRLWALPVKRHLNDFNPRTPYGMRLPNELNCNRLVSISIHAPLTGCDTWYLHIIYLLTVISIHAPLTGCDTFTFASFKFSLNFNPRTPYGMRHDVLHKQERIINISIHAPLTGCDSINFSVLLHGMIFQSTHPLRDATFYKEMNINEIKYFNPRTPYGMRQRLLNSYTLVF